jgi:hypothetical protein
VVQVPPPVIRVRRHGEESPTPPDGGTTMAVIAHVVLRGVDRATYDKVRAECGWLDAPPDGGLAHLAWFDGDDNHNVDAWESEEAFARFGETRLAPALARTGVDVEPEVTFSPAHEVFLPAAVTRTVS